MIFFKDDYRFSSIDFLKENFRASFMFNEFYPIKFRLNILVAKK